MTIKGYDVGTLLKRTWKEIGDDKIALYAAQVAYSAFFSLFPMLLFFAALVSVVADRNLVMGWLARSSSALPPAVATLLTETARKVIFAEGAPGLLSFGLLTAAWSGSSAFGALREALNAAYDATETRPWWKQHGLQLGMLALCGVVLVVSTVVLVNGEGVVSWVGNRLGLGATFRTAWTLLQFPIAIAAAVGVLWMQYYVLPNCAHKSRMHVAVGAVVAALLWIGATLLFRLYVQRFHTMNAAYGAVGAIMVLLTWLYYSAFVLLAAGELNSELEHGTGRADTQGRVTGAAASQPVPRDRALVPVAEGDGAGRWAAHVRAGDAVGPIGGNGRPEFAVAPGAASVGGADDGRGLGGLLKGLAGGGVHLVRQELRLARVELMEAGRAMGAGGMMIAAGAVLALLGALATASGLVLLAGDQWLPSDAYWLAALLVTLLAGGAAWWLVRRGRALLSAEALKPRETIETLQEDARWLNRPTTSGATSR